MTLYIENIKDVTKKLLELINESGKVAGYKINTKQSAPFLYTNNKRLERENSGNNSIYHHLKKNEIPINKPI